MPRTARDCSTERDRSRRAPIPTSVCLPQCAPSLSFLAPSFLRVYFFSHPPSLLPFPSSFFPLTSLTPYPFHLTFIPLHTLLFATRKTFKPSQTRSTFILFSSRLFAPRIHLSSRFARKFTRNTDCSVAESLVPHTNNTTTRSLPPLPTTTTTTPHHSNNVLA